LQLFVGCRKDGLALLEVGFDAGQTTGKGLVFVYLILEAALFKGHFGKDSLELFFFPPGFS